VPVLTGECQAIAGFRCQVNRLKTEGNNRWAGGPLLSVCSLHSKWHDWRRGMEVCRVCREKI